MPIIDVTTLYGHNTKKGIVDIRAPNKHLQLEPVEARAYALNLLQAAEAAEQDQFIVEAFQELIDLSLEDSAKMLALFRQKRIQWNQNK